MEISGLPRKFREPQGASKQSAVARDCFRKYQQELVPTHANREISAANRSIKSRSEFLQHQIPRGMPYVSLISLNTR